MSAEEFVAQFGEIAEHSAWVAAGAARPFASPSEMCHAFTHVVQHAAAEQQLALLRAHPDLATRAKLTLDSQNEQMGAGLDSLSADEFAKFTSLNEQYKSQNGFPFIFAVKGATKQQILASFETRIHNSREDEFQVALQQVCRIIAFRIDAKVQA